MKNAFYKTKLSLIHLCSSFLQFPNNKAGHAGEFN